MKHPVLLTIVFVTAASVNLHAQSSEETHGAMLERVKKAMQNDVAKGDAMSVAQYLASHILDVQGAALTALVGTK